MNMWLFSSLLITLCGVSFAASYESRGRRAAESDEAPLSCGQGWFSFGDMCYKMFGQMRSSRLSWERASEACRTRHHGSLVSIHSQELQDFLTTHMLLNARSLVWIGFNDRRKENEYKWEDGSVVDFTDWDPIEPRKPYSEHEDCIEMLYVPWRKNEKPGKWNDVNCDNSYHYICQKRKERRSRIYPDPRFCTDEEGGGWKFESSCFHLVTQPKNWFDAEQYCVQNYGGHLATISDFAIDSYLGYVFHQRNQDVWIGVKTDPDKEQQSWSSGWFVSYENWEEKDVPIGCVAFSPEGKWRHKPCRREIPFICEVSTVVPPAMKPGPKGGSCPKEPKGWRDLGGERCYFFDPEARATWPEANLICMRRGGTLASLHSIEEINVLHNFERYAFTDSLMDGHNSVHIGLFRREPDQDFIWADGSPVDFLHWAPGEDSSQHEQCVEIIRDTFMWNDIDCGARRGFFCSVPKTREKNALKPDISITPETTYQLCRKAVFGLSSKSGQHHPFMAGKTDAQTV